MALAWPICRIPFGSGGNLVLTFPPVRLRCCFSNISVFSVTTYPSVLWFWPGSWKFSFLITSRIDGLESVNPFSGSLFAFFAEVTILGTAFVIEFIFVLGADFFFFKFEIRSSSVLGPINVNIYKKRLKSIIKFFKRRCNWKGNRTCKSTSVLTIFPSAHFNLFLTSCRINPTLNW